MRTKLTAALFAIYLVLLFWTIVWKLAPPSIGSAALLPHPIKWVPFVPSGDADGSAPLELLANVVLFVPFGFYLGLLAPRWRWWATAAVFVTASLILETVQHLLSTGIFDVTDLITNTAGGLLGLLLARRVLRDDRPAALTKVLVIATAVALVAVAAFVASPLRYNPQPDVIVPRPSATP